uniref:FAS1 domain-containing protein n=1 Tax=Pyramimonas obovata TaxID=1411642 RepID=A0A7S0QUD4_9CHLO|eukprot:CAMPEP_0118932276 /NCGR_PEP_ID=MMETSP1169-20130426/9705_1 /TAXON_ID=36882 /ORGANISM="Pyramimonas obovata, Strain CCMP722" /LENGTH=334 /DNA_ID=CAMNT_0006874909 /DNA_START=61 /DNA_END=1065 /DNA_ORIENTATION=-
MSAVMGSIGMASSVKVAPNTIKVSRAASRSFKAALARPAVSVRAVATDDLAQKYSKSSVLDVAKEEPDFSILNQAIANAGLGDALSKDGPFTMFGPTNAAFERLAEERGLSIVEVLEMLEEGVLADILKYHVVPGEAVYSADLEGREALPTIQGYELDITKDDGVQVDGASLVTKDVKLTNGVLHAVDEVLVPPFSMQAKLSEVSPFDWKDGWVGPTLNGRLAMLGWVYALGGEFNSGESFLTQVAHHFGDVAFAVALWSLATVAPAMNSSIGYTANPSSINTTKEWKEVMKGGPWLLVAPYFTPELERTLGLAAMGGLVGLTFIELFKGSALF